MSSYSMCPGRESTTCFRVGPVTAAALVALSVLSFAAAASIAGPPQVLDDRLEIQLFAEAPQVVTPTGIAVAPDGAVLVIESHTHFRPENYQGPQADRVLRMVDSDNDGRADRITTYFSGTKATMNLAVAPGGDVLLATRNEILHLLDTNRDGVAEDSRRLVFLETKGDYPHNGLSGFAFFEPGWFYFGLGENLGEAYALVGADGTTIRGGGEGGSIYRCRHDGSRLQRVATGFWNPFHLAFDVYGRLFAVDNDPDWRPPCRLLHIVSGGDYGYRFRNGRRGLHPFTAWFGRNPGTLGMVAGTGEAPSGVLSYQGSLLPESYQGALLSTSWGMHSLERFRLEPRGASFQSQAETFVKGDSNFRPVGIAMAPDGSLMLSDWVDRSYQLHGKGRVWRVSRKGSSREAAPAQAGALGVGDLTKLAAAGRQQVAAGEPQQMVALLQSPLAERRAVAIRVLGQRVNAEQWDRLLHDPSAGVRALAVATRNPAPAELPGWQDQLAARLPEEPQVRAAILRRLDPVRQRELLVAALADTDPFVRTAARSQLATASLAWTIEHPLPAQSPEARSELGLLLRASGLPAAQHRIDELLSDSDLQVRLTGLIWVGEERLRKFRSQVQRQLSRSDTSGRIFEASLAALQALDGELTGAEFEKQSERLVADLLTNSAGTLSDIALANALERLPRASQVLTAPRLEGWLTSASAHVRSAAIRAMGREHRKLLTAVANDTEQPPHVRGEAVVALGEQVLGEQAERLEPLVRLAAQRPVQRDALRALTAVAGALSPSQRRQLQALSDAEPALAPLVARVFDPAWKARPATDEAAVRAVLQQQPGDAAQGQRIFHSAAAQCARCHRRYGRGASIGPDLTSVGLLPRDRLIQSLVNPSQEIAPQFTSWIVTTQRGEVFTGLLVGEQSGKQFYADAQGVRREVGHSEIDRRQPSPLSLMPEGLLQRLTDQEIRDLFAFLQQRN